jgi:multiple sugar transport system permease protein
VWPLLITFTEEMKTMPVGLGQLSPAISHQQTNSLGQAMAGATLLTIPSLGIFLLLQRYFIAGVSRSGIDG